MHEKLGSHDELRSEAYPLSKTTTALPLQQIMRIASDLDD